MRQQRENEMRKEREQQLEEKRDDESANVDPKKKNQPKFKQAVAIRKIVKTKYDLMIDEENISLMMGKNCHVVIYPINKKKELLEKDNIILKEN